jgi:hypothetical protein
VAGPLHGSRAGVGAGRSLHGQQGGEPGHEPIELDEGVRTCRASSGRQHCDHHRIYRDSINLHWYGILVILEGSGFLHGWGLRSESMIGTCMCSGVREFDWIGWRLGFRGPTSGQCSLWLYSVDDRRRRAGDNSPDSDLKATLPFLVLCTGASCCLSRIGF